MVDLSQVAKAIQKVSVSVPGIVSGTVAGSTDTGVLVILDSDPSRNAVSAISLVGIGAVKGARVLCLRYPPRGLVVLGFLELPAPTIVRQYISAATWTKPEGIRGVWVELQAGGGGSGGTTTTPAAGVTPPGSTSGSGGGQGGGYAKFWVPAVDLPSSVAVTVGFGGNGGATGGGNGGAGTASSFGTLGSIPGGAGGAGGGTQTYNNVAGATSQSGGTGNQLFTGSVGSANALVLPGSDGGTGFRISLSPTVIPGSGGASFLAGRREPLPITGSGSQTNQIAGAIGNGPGGGGVGPANMGTAGVAGQIGGFGADGLVFVTEIYY